jgi:hypothetical protein
LLVNNIKEKIISEEEGKNKRREIWTGSLKSFVHSHL